MLLSERKVGDWLSIFCVRTAEKRDKLVKRAREQAEEEEKGKF